MRSAFSISIFFLQEMAAGNQVHTSWGLAPSSPASSVSSDFKTLSILLVDDEYLCLTVTKALLTQAGHQVTMTWSAVDALNILRSGTSQFDIILSDLYMPEMNGLQLIDQITKENIGIPIALLSADEEPMIMQQGLAAGAACFYTKPVTLNVSRTLSQVVDSWKKKTMMMASLVADNFPYTNPEPQLNTISQTATPAAEWTLNQMFDSTLMSNPPSIDAHHHHRIMPASLNYNNITNNNDLMIDNIGEDAGDTEGEELNQLQQLSPYNMAFNFHHGTISSPPYPYVEAAEGERGGSLNGSQQIDQEDRLPLEQHQQKVNGGRLKIKKKMVWTDELHHRFIAALNTIGPDKAVPTTILKEMNHPGITRDQVSSHLQRHRRLELKKESAASKKEKLIQRRGHDLK